MKLVIDSSAFAKRYVYEKGSEKLESVLQDTSKLAFSILLIPEIISALNRKLREKVLTSDEYQNIKQQLLEDVEDTIVLQLTPGVISRSLALLENHTVRAMDALHIACALEWDAEFFATADNRQLLAAKREGLQTKYIG